MHGMSGGNPWEVGGYIWNTTNIATPIEDIDEPKPRKDESKSAFIQRLVDVVIRRVYEVIYANRTLDSSDWEDVGIHLAEEEFIKSRADQYVSFPDLSSKYDIALVSKLALATPCNPELLILNDPNRLVDILSGLEYVSELAVKATKVASQWLRECFGDESMPKDQEIVTITTNLAAGLAFHCNGCKKAMKVQAFRIRCAECDDFDLCKDCFCQGIELQDHRKTHYYIPIGPSQEPLFNPQWSADEELLLLDAVGKFGLGNWVDVADYVSGATTHNSPLKDKDACETRYFDFHLLKKDSENDPFYPIASLLNPPAYSQWSNFLTHMNECYNDPKPGVTKEESSDRPTFGALSPANALKPESNVKVLHTLVLDPPTLPPKTQVVHFLQHRGDFEEEHDNSAELVIADLEIRENESPMEKELKLQALEHYNCVLDDRMRRKKLVVERRLFDQKYLSQHEKLKPIEEKNLHDLFKPLWKHTVEWFSESRPPLFDSNHKTSAVCPDLFETDVEEFIHVVLEDRALVQRLNLLSAWNTAGMRTVRDVFEMGGAIAEAMAKTCKAAKDAEQTASSTGGEDLLGGQDIEVRFSQMTGISAEFLAVLKSSLERELFSLNIDKQSGLKNLTNDVVQVNDFLIDVKIQNNKPNSSLEMEEGPTIPKKRKHLQQDGDSNSSNAPSLFSDYADDAFRAGHQFSDIHRLTGRVLESPALIPPQETEEGEIEEDEEAVGTSRSFPMMVIPPPPPTIEQTEECGGRGGKRVKQHARRGSGGLAPAIAQRDSISPSDSGGAVSDPGGVGSEDADFGQKQPLKSEDFDDDDDEEEDIEDEEALLLDDDDEESNASSH